MFDDKFNVFDIVKISNFKILEENNKKVLKLFIDFNVSKMSDKLLNNLQNIVLNKTNELNKYINKISTPEKFVLKYEITEEGIKALRDKKNLENLKTLNQKITDFFADMISLKTKKMINLSYISFLGEEDINKSEIIVSYKNYKHKINVDFLNISRHFFETPFPLMQNFYINECFDVKILRIMNKIEKIELKEETRAFIEKASKKRRAGVDDEIQYRKFLIDIYKKVYLDGFLAARISYLITYITVIPSFYEYANNSKNYGLDLFSFEISNEFSLKEKINNKKIIFIVSAKVDRKSLDLDLKIEAKSENKIYKLSEKNKNGLYKFNFLKFFNFIKDVYGDYEVSLFDIKSEFLSFCEMKINKDILIENKEKNERYVKSIKFRDYSNFYSSLDGYIINEENNFVESIITIEAALGIIQGFFVNFFE